MVGLGCVIIVVLIWSGRGAGVAVESNYNYSLVHEQALLSDPTVLPVRLLPHHSHRSHLPLLLETFHLKKFELRDTDYHLPQHNASPADEELVYSMEPPAGVFAFETMTIENYRLLEMRRFSISLSNPSRKFTLCVSEILPDSEELRRSDERGSLPACLGPLSSRQFNFTLYAAFLNPQYIRATVYFFIDLYDEQRLVEEKVYPRRVFATVTPNHLRLETAHLRNCPLPHTLALKNYEIFPIDLYIEHKKRLYSSEGAPLDQPSRVHPTKSLKIEVEGRSAQMIIHTSASEGHPHHFPPLLLKTYCEEPLSLDYYNIGIIPDERMVIEVPVSISSLSPHNATILAIHVDASSETVTVEAEPAFAGTVPPQQKNLIIGVMRVHSRAKPERSSSILVKVSYRLQDEEYTASQRYRYCEIRHPVAVGQKRFVDVSKINRSGEAARMGEHRFPIRNNLNVPLYLLRVIFDESLFQLSWLQDRRNFIYPNHNRE